MSDEKFWFNNKNISMIHQATILINQISFSLNQVSEIVE